jgi:hypothetical protein
VKEPDVRNSRPDQAEQQRLLRKLYVITLVFLLPATAIWILAEALGWTSHLFDVHTFWDGLVLAFFVASLMYYGVVVHVLRDRVRWSTWVRHLIIAVPLMASALLLSTLHFSGATREIAEGISSVIHLSSGAVGVLSTVAGWVLSGVAGNFAYDLIKRQLKQEKSRAEKPGRKSKRKKKTQPAS